jgi:uncharacterized protein (DUF58 family)
VFLSGIGLVWGVLRELIWGLDVALLVAAVIDLRLTPPPDRLEIDRELPERAGLSREFRRVLRIAHPRAGGLRVRVHEQFPSSFEVLRRWEEEGEVEGVSDDPTGGEDRAHFDRSGHTELVRVYRSSLRGLFRFGDLRVRVRGRFGLVERQARVSGPQEIAVEPALTGLRRTLRLAASDRWFDLGVRLLRQRGGETEFESLREYVPGDEVRRVDWKAFARRGKPMVRQYQVERGQELILLVDGGRRMRASGSEGRGLGWTKLDWAIDTALQLAAVALSKGDRVGGAIFDRRLKVWVAPARRGRQLSRLSEAFFPQQPTANDADLARALRELAVRHRRRATVLVVSDVADPLSIDHQRRALAAASRRHRIIFAALDDPEVRAAAAGEGVGAAERAAALDLVEDRRRALRLLAGSGARVLDALPAELAAPMLAAWLEERRGEGRGVGRRA